MTEYQIDIAVDREYEIELGVDINFSYLNITRIVNVISGGSSMAADNMRWDKVTITTNPQVIVFRKGIGSADTPFVSTNWVITFPLCLDASNNEVTPVISARTINGFTASMGDDLPGTLEYISIE